MQDARIAIIGAGKMARLLLVHLDTQGVTRVTIVNRSRDPAKVQALRDEFPNLTLDFRLMDELWDVIRMYDVVYPSTAAESTIIDPEPLRECLSTRGTGGPDGRKGVQFVDISVPRNVHPDCAQVEGAFCYNVDDLKLVVPYPES